MIIPIFQAAQYVDETGYLTSYSQLYNDSLNSTLREGLSDNGWTLPQVTPTELTAIAAFTGLNEMPDGTLWYVVNGATSQLVVKINGALRQVTTTAYP